MAVKNQEGILDIFDCVMGVKQGCPLSATLFGLFVDGLEQHLMNTLGHDAPSLSGVLIPLLLYADDLTIMSDGVYNASRATAAASCNATILRATTVTTHYQPGQDQGGVIWLQSQMPSFHIQWQQSGAHSIIQVSRI